jgi:hypothetical protein
MPDYAVPFYQALDKLARGSRPEYESRIFAIYQSLCGPGIQDHGDLAVTAALDQTRALSEAMKSLEQSIRAHLDRLFAADLAIPEILQAHYGDYQTQVVDTIYNRIKTSDHLSRFRPLILAQVRNLLADTAWLAASAHLWLRRQGGDAETARQSLVDGLQEIADILRDMDPLVERIDDKNRRYTRLSIERIKSRLYRDDGLGEQLASLIRRLSARSAESWPHGLSAAAWLGPDSLAKPRRSRDNPAELQLEISGIDRELLATELLMRVQGQLDLGKLRQFLGPRCPPGSTILAASLVESPEDLVRVMYTGIFAARQRMDFPFEVAWDEGWAEAAGYRFRAHRIIAHKETGRDEPV